MIDFAKKSFNIFPATEALSPANSHRMLALHMVCEGYQ
jgi:hypothetical protein